MDSFILLAGGSGSRLGGEVNKVYLALAGAPLITYPLRAIRVIGKPVNLVVVARRQDRLLLDDILSEYSDLQPKVVIGGATRFQSEAAGLEEIAASSGDYIGIHDGARPFLTASLWEACRATAEMIGGAIPVIDPGPLFRKSDDRLHRLDGVIKAQTPQVFSGPELVETYRRADRPAFDTAEIVERFSDLAIATVTGDARNLKVTTPEDLSRAGSLVGQWSPEGWLAS